MPPSFYHWQGADGAITAFHQGKLMMNFGSPMAHVSLSVIEMQNFIQTIERAIDDEPNSAQQMALNSIRIVFQCALNQHQRDHEQLIEEAPTGADLEEYMLSYARAIQEGTL